MCEIPQRGEQKSLLNKKSPIHIFISKTQQTLTDDIHLGQQHMAKPTGKINGTERTEVNTQTYTRHVLQ